MEEYRQCRNLADEAAQQIDVERMWEDLERFSKLERYTGSPAGEAAVDLICERMKEYGVDCTREYYDAFRSLPVDGSLKVLTAKGETLNFSLTPYVYSASCSDLEAPVVFDEAGRQKGGALQLFDTGKSVSTQKNETQRFANFEGKIVFTLDSSYDFAMKAKRAGAVGIITAYALDVKHHGSLGGVWGNPDVDDLASRYPWLPYGELKKSDSDKLVALMDADEVAGVVMNIKQDNSIVKASIPVATVHGQSEKFVLISGHYDSWYEGMTDNAVANIAMVEMARVFKQYEGKLRRSVKFAWWCGHSDARYAGSTWYSDHHFMELKENCVAHLNMDICGFADLDHVTFLSSLFERGDFNQELLREYNKAEPAPSEAMRRFADQTFWATRVPFSVMPKFGEYHFGSMDIPFWHTPEDTFDKCNKPSTLRDTACMTKLACYYLESAQLPADFTGFLGFMESTLQNIEKQVADEFDLSPVWPCLEKAKKTARKLEELMPGKDSDDIVVQAGGELVRLVYSYSSCYAHDAALPQPAFPRLSLAMGKTRENTTPDYYLALETTFQRQVNRLVGQITMVIKMMEDQIDRWSR